tara:strand:- start:462 stop:1616 length:1155 start_codon:yes stop_codon:yes gene_type:complete
MSAPAAAMINSCMAHALDFDDTLDFAGNIHIGASCIPAALAVSDYLNDVTGEELITSLCMGLETSCHLAVIAEVDRGWHRTSTFGIFGATATVSKLLKLKNDQIVNALGIGLSYASGTRQCISDGVLTKRMQAGIAAQNAVYSAFFSQCGLTGAKDPFWGEYGFFPMYQPDAYNEALDFKDFGTEYILPKLSFKPFPAGRPTHKFINVGIKISKWMQENKITFSSIKTIEIRCNKATIERHESNSEPIRPPSNQIEAQFHVPFLLSAAVIHGKFGLLELERIADKSIIHLSSICNWQTDNSYYEGSGQLVIGLGQGEFHGFDFKAEEMTQAPDFVENLIKEKFFECLNYSKEVNFNHASELWDMLQEVECLNNVSALTELMAKL